jgi:hypothetical protein
MVFVRCVGKKTPVPDEQAKVTRDKPLGVKQED